jgi:hypothetical protein
MFLSRAAGRSASLRCAGALWRPAALLLTLTLGACSSAGTSIESASWSPSQIAGPSSAMPPATGMRPRVEIEGDGLEGQLPPRRRDKEATDDPSEPFSPNYGATPSVEPGYGSDPA